MTDPLRRQSPHPLERTERLFTDGHCRVRVRWLVARGRRGAETGVEATLFRTPCCGDRVQRKSDSQRCQGHLGMWKQIMGCGNKEALSQSKSFVSSPAFFFNLLVHVNCPVLPPDLLSAKGTTRVTEAEPRKGHVMLASGTFTFRLPLLPSPGYLLTPVGHSHLAGLPGPGLGAKKCPDERQGRRLWVEAHTLPIHPL